MFVMGMTVLMGSDSKLGLPDAIWTIRRAILSCVHSGFSSAVFVGVVGIYQILSLCHGSNPVDMRALGNLGGRVYCFS